MANPGSFSRSDLADILLQGVSGTSFMTLFSYCVANVQNKQFREPVLLAILIRRLYPRITEKESFYLGWLLHYMVGCTFTAAFNRIWKKTWLSRNIFSGLIPGGICGIIGVAVWESVFRIHPYPPRINLKQYYGQLFIAHLVFGAFAAISNIRRLKRIKTSTRIPENERQEETYLFI